MAFFSDLHQPVVLFKSTVITSYAAVSSTELDLQTANADSVFVMALLTGSASAGFSMTAQGSASSSTAAYGQYWATAGSSASVMTVGSTAQGKVVYMDLKNVPHRFFRVLHVGTDAVDPQIIAFPYDSKKRKVPVSADLPSTSESATSFKTCIAPTTA
jgi:hypothetical protein